ncbi:MAG: N-6 DNA methylase [Myxococcales bacterium]|nr:N-6 DNA methylase [Myxococcales bacterium]
MPDSTSHAALARELAADAQELRARVLAALRVPCEQGPTPLRRLREVVAAHDVRFRDDADRRDPDDVFADVFAQCSTCALVVARSLHGDAARPFTRLLAANALARAGGELTALARALVVDTLRLDASSEASSNAPSEASSEASSNAPSNNPPDEPTRAVIARLDQLACRLAARPPVEPGSDPLARLYEPLLAAYDGARRRARGVYYTPDAIVDYMLELADELRRRAGAPPCVHVLEPAAGTGAFLRGLLRRLRARDDVEAPRAVEAVELLVVPHVLCQLRLLTRDRPRDVELTLRRADALELEDTNDVAPTWTLVLGNPPYRNNSERTLAQVAARFPALLARASAAATAQARTIRDDYAWFFALAEARTRTGGAICLITPDSYLRKPSYRLFREDLLRRYRVVRLTRLGAGVFPGVGPRIGFAIIALLRRPAPLDERLEALSGERVELLDLAPLAASAATGAPDDPRLRWLAAAARGRAPTKPRPHHFTPAREHSFRLVPPEPGAARLPLQLVARDATVRAPLFRRKWPGVITAFDRLLAARERDELRTRIARLVDVARARPSRRAAELDALAESLELDPRQRARLELVAAQVREQHLELEPARLKPVFAGSIPATRAWAPPLSHARWIYYEPRLRIPRNTHANKATGWGWMQQWRDPASHEVFPKLIFTTSSNPRYGFRAHVVDAGWYAKLHGAASQQFHYLHARGNLDEAGLALLDMLCETCPETPRDHALLHLVAALYNSAHGRAYAAREAEPMLPLPRLDHRLGRALAPRLVADARWLRQLHAAAQPPVADAFPETPIDLLRERLGPAPRAPEARARWLARVEDARLAAQRRLDEAVARLLAP